MWIGIKKIFRLFLIFSFSIITASAQEVQNNFIIEGIKMYDKGDYEGALEMYKKALTSNPASVQAKYEMASTYLQLKDYTNAIKYSEKVIAANKDYADQAYIVKGTALDYLNKPQDAANIYKQALKKFPKNQLLYYNLALTSLNLKNYNETDCSFNTFFIIFTIFSPFSVICPSVHNKLIAVEIQRLITASLAAKSLLA